MTLQDYLDEHGIVHFSAKELYSREKRGGPKVTEPPEELWPNILETLKLADKIRSQFGSAVRVVSGYRSPSYNKLVGGAKKSEHMLFKALDLQPADGTAFKLFKDICKRVIGYADADGMRTGMGIYKKFIHIDTGSTKGRRRRWYGKGVAK